MGNSPDTGKSATWVPDMYYQASTTARDSFARGDEVLQLAIPLNQQSGRVGPGGGESFVAAIRRQQRTQSGGPRGLVIGHRVVVFVPTTETSRDKFWLSGQQVAISGEVVGYYVFTRDETKRKRAPSRRCPGTSRSGQSGAPTHQRNHATGPATMTTSLDLRRGAAPDTYEPMRDVCRGLSLGRS